MLDIIKKKQQAGVDKTTSGKKRKIIKKAEVPNSAASSPVEVSDFSNPTPAMMEVLKKKDEAEKGVMKKVIMQYLSEFIQKVWSLFER